MTVGHLSRTGLSAPASHGRTAWVGEDTPPARFADMPRSAVPPAASFLRADAADMPRSAAQAVALVAAIPVTAAAVHIRIAHRIPVPDFRMVVVPAAVLAVPVFPYEERFPAVASAAEQAVTEQVAAELVVEPPLQAVFEAVAEPLWAVGQVAASVAVSAPPSWRTGRPDS